jgi:hypothetical protein
MPRSLRDFRLREPHMMERRRRWALWNLAIGIITAALLVTSVALDWHGDWDDYLALYAAEFMLLSGGWDYEKFAM